MHCMMYRHKPLLDRQTDKHHCKKKFRPPLEPDISLCEHQHTLTDRGSSAKRAILAKQDVLAHGLMQACTCEQTCTQTYIIPLHADVRLHTHCTWQHAHVNLQRGIGSWWLGHVLQGIGCEHGDRGFQQCKSMEAICQGGSSAETVSLTLLACHAI